MQLLASIVVAIGVRPGLAGMPVPDRAYKVERSDKYFHKDLKHDNRPHVTKWHTQYEFESPYPHVQLENNYDKDYVSDENNDHGEWKTQEEYDHLRIHIVKVQAEVDRLRAQAAKDQKAYDEARAAEGKLEDKSQQMESALDDAKKAAERAQKKVDSAKVLQNDAKDDVKEEMDELDMCREELEQAKDLLERMLAEHDMEQDDLEEHQNKYPDGTFQDPAAKAYEEVAIDDAKLRGAETHYKLTREQYDAMVKKVSKTKAELDDLKNKIDMYRNGEDPFAAEKVAANIQSGAERVAPLLLPLAAVLVMQ